MGFDLVTGIVVIAGIALVVLGVFVVGRAAFKAPRQDEGVNASQELTPHPPGRVGRVEESDAPNRQMHV